MLYQLSYAPEGRPYSGIGPRDGPRDVSPIGSALRSEPGAHDGGMVGLSGLEPLTSRLSGERSNQLSYRPGVWRARTQLAWKKEGDSRP